MEAVTRTIYGSALQSALLLGIPYSIKEFTTLNEKLGIQNGVMPQPSIYPKVNYFCIGNGGHQMTVGADNIPLSKINQHKATDAALFKHLPFALRAPGNDLLADERARYALRREESFNGNIYIAYYLKRIDVTEVVSELDYRTVVNGVVTSTPFVPTSSMLSPTPVVINNTGTNTITSDYITVSTLLSVGFTAAEIAELLNVANVMYGNESYAIISEIGLCSGVDKVVNVTPSSGGSFNFNEAIAVQITSFISAFHVAQYTSSGLSKLLDVGVNEPLLSIS
jgi:hypothetical protein